MPKRKSKGKEPIDELAEELQGVSEEIKGAAEDIPTAPEAEQSQKARQSTRGAN